MPADSSSRPFLFDAAHHLTRTYAELWRTLDLPTVRFRPILRPSSLAQVADHLLAALAADHDITLVDAETSPEELAALGLPAADLDREILAPTRHRADTFVELLTRLRDSSTGNLRLFTSGSTGLPKAVRHPLANLCRAVRQGPRYADDVWAFAYSATHIAGIQVLLQALFNQNVLVPVAGRSREEIWAALHRHRISHLSATPSFFRLLLPPDAPVPTVRSVTVGGEASDPALVRRLRDAFPAARFHNIYASTEAGTLLVSDGDVFHIPTDLARQVRIHLDRLQVHASLLGDFGDRPASADGWYDTGDVVEPAPDGGPGFRIVSRDRDWLNVGGHKVNPAEIESALRDHPGVREVRVFGRPHPLVGNLVCADIVRTDPALTEAELRTLLAPRLQSFKLPRLIRFVDALEHTRTGKLKRHE